MNKEKLQQLFDEKKQIELVIEKFKSDCNQKNNFMEKTLKKFKMYLIVAGSLFTTTIAIVEFPVYAYISMFVGSACLIKHIFIFGDLYDISNELNSIENKIYWKEKSQKMIEDLIQQIKSEQLVNTQENNNLSKQKQDLISFKSELTNLKEEKSPQDIDYSKTISM